MRMLPLPEGGLRLRLDFDEAHLLDQLVGQLIDLLRSHSGTALDPDPLFASLEVGGSETPPDDPALARLFPDAYEGAGDASQFRRVTEQGLVNRKLQDALEVSGSLGVGSLPDAGGGDDPQPVELDITDTALPAWARTLTALRLAIAARLGIGDEADHSRLAEDEETRGTLLVYDWLAAILDSLLRMGPSD